MMYLDDEKEVEIKEEVVEIDEKKDSNKGILNKELPVFKKKQDELDKKIEDNCLFCKIVRGEVPAKIIAENDHALAFLDINPISDGHTLVIPKKHYQDLGVCDTIALNSVINLAKSISRIIEKSHLDAWGFNYLSNQGAIAGQVVMHFHMHVIPKYAKNEGLEFSADNKYLAYDLDKVQKELIRAAKKLEKKGGLFSKIEGKPYDN